MKTIFPGIAAALQPNLLKFLQIFRFDPGIPQDRFRRHSVFFHLYGNFQFCFRLLRSAPIVFPRSVQAVHLRSAPIVFPHSVQAVRLRSAPIPCRRNIRSNSNHLLVFSENFPSYGQYFYLFELKFR